MPPAKPKTDPPKLKVEYVPVKDLKPYPQNPRTHSAEQVAQINGSIGEFGWTNPVLVDADGEVIGGHGRLEAAAQRGIETVPVIRLGHLTPEQVRAYRIADNRLTELGEWDAGLLGAELEALKAADFDIDLTGFGLEDLEGLLDEEGGASLGDPDDAGEPPDEPVTQPGDVWVMGRHRLICGDSTDAETVNRVMDGAEFDLIVTSPPYNQKIDGFSPSGMHKEGGWVEKVASKAYSDDMPEHEYQEWQVAILALWASHLKDTGSFFYNHKNRYRGKRVVSPLEWLPGPLTLRQEIIWSRPGSVTQNARMFLPSDERIFWMYKGKDFIFNDSTDIKSFSTVWPIAPKPNPDHAVPFPIEIPERCIMACSQRGQIVGDPFCGSGTTVIAAERQRRACYAVEISPAYCDVIVRRWQDFTGKSAVLEATGKSPLARA